MNKAFLYLEDGKFFEGKQVGNPDDVVGELCFNTSMTGYQEIFTDPSYAGQIVTMTTSHIGNTGANLLDMESKKIHLKSILCRNLELSGSNFRKEEELDQFLNKNKISISYGLDTRAIVRHLRNQGVMRALISREKISPEIATQRLKDVPQLSQQDLVSQVTCQKPYDFELQDIPNQYYIDKEDPTKLNLAVIDCGIKLNILQSLSRLGFNIRVFSSSASCEEIENYNPNGLFISNGPGDPQQAKAVIKTAAHFHKKIPVMGICLGMQIIGLMRGAKTFKLKFGHRGANHPVKDLRNGAVAITSQNHGFAIDEETLPKGLEVSHKNWNDFTVAGIAFPSEGLFAVQHHPEASPGPHDSLGVFHEFKKIVQNWST